MHLSIFLLVLGVVVATAEEHFLSDAHINKINNAQNTWTAGRNFDKNTPKSQIKSLLGVKAGYKTTLPKKTVEIVKDLPENFDAREKWSQCKRINEIRDQSTCGSCWAVAAVSAMSDRTCIRSNGKIQVSLSAKDLMACCSFCGDGCNGGYPSNAWVYWTTDGIVSGGPYGSHEGCLTYPFPSCEHHTTGSRPPCGDVKRTPVCSVSCDQNATVIYGQDLHFGDDSYSISSDVDSIKSEIYNSGPVEASFAVYEDFTNYKSGVYQYTQGELLGYHAVRILGWGVENNVSYWLAANSWNEDWGDKGYFKIRSGTDECEIEEDINAGVPYIPPF